jgi:hypothetical protein
MKHGTALNFNQADHLPERRGSLARGLGFVMASLLMLLPALTHAQSDTAHARQVFTEVNKQLPQLQQVSFSTKRPGVDYKAEGKAWAQDGVVKKIEIIERDDSGDVVSEFYYAGATLVFVFEMVKGFSDSGNSNKQVAINEERYYYRDGKLFKWLSGMGKDKSENLPSSAAFADVGKSRLAASTTFQAAALKALAAIPASK